MAKYALLGLAGLSAAVLAAMLLQHLHYLDVRRHAAQDRQPLFYDKDAFQVVTFLKVREGADAIEAVRRFKQKTAGQGQWIYAGKVVVNVPSAQIGPVEWSAVALVQYPSRKAYETEAASAAYASALAEFERWYAQGARRNPVANLMLPQALLLKKLARAAKFAKSAYPFTPVDPAKLPARGIEMVRRLRAESTLGARGAVVVNLMKRGSAAQGRSDARYAGAMQDLMADRGYGPLHLAKAEALPGDFNFDNVAIVYYPGTNYFADMFGSTFYQGILPNKQLGDNQSTITVPILDLLN
jgi:hypothetical protein